MEQEQKEKLLKYLCMALPYWVKCFAEDSEYGDMGILYSVDPFENADPNIYIQYYKGNVISFFMSEVKPYLRPMSSMTEEEKKEYQYITERWMYDANHSIADSIDWLLENHFDFMGLIPIGRAIDCTDLDIY